MIDKHLTDEMTDKQILFCECYIVHLNGTRAATEAKYQGDNIGIVAAQLLANPKCQAYITALRQEQKENLGISADRVLLELARLSFYDPRDIYDEHGCVRPPSEWPEDVARAVKTIRTKELFVSDGHGGRRYIGDAKEVVLEGKKGSLQLIGMHLGIFKKDNEQKTSKVIVVTPEDAKTIMDGFEGEI